MNTETPQEVEKSSEIPSQHQVLMEWIAPAYLRPEKSKVWYIIMGLIVLGFIIYGMLYDTESYSWIVSITFVLLAGVYMLYEMKPVHQLKVSVTDHGIRYGGKNYQYQQIQSFWVTMDRNIRILHLRLYNGMPREISIYISADINTSQLREVLQTQIREEEGRRERLSDQVIRNFGL